MTSAQELGADRIVSTINTPHSSPSYTSQDFDAIIQIKGLGF